MTEDPHRWSQPFAALLGAYSAQLGFGLPSIGGKDSMSGTFNDIDVPPTLVSFAVDIASYKHIITPEFKKAGNKLVLLKVDRDAYDLPDYEKIMDQYGKFFEDVKAGKIISAYALDGKGVIPAVSKMAFGNKLGVKLEHNLDPRDAFAPGFGSIVAEVPAGKVGELSITYTEIGEVTVEWLLPTAMFPSVPRKHWMHGKEHWRKYSRPSAEKNQRSTGYTDLQGRQHLCMQTSRWQNRPYLSRYSRVPTASTTVRKHLSAQVRM